MKVTVTVEIVDARLEGDRVVGFIHSDTEGRLLLNKTPIKTSRVCSITPMGDFLFIVTANSVYKADSLKIYSKTPSGQIKPKQVGDKTISEHIESLERKLFDLDAQDKRLSEQLKVLRLMSSGDKNDVYEDF